MTNSDRNTDPQPLRLEETVIQKFALRAVAEREVLQKELKMIGLDELEKLAKEATPGPWSHIRDIVIGDESKLFESYNDNVEDARFVAAANPSTVLDLVAEIKELRSILAELARVDFGKDWNEAAEQAAIRARKAIEAEVSNIRPTQVCDTTKKAKTLEGYRLIKWPPTEEMKRMVQERLDYERLYGGSSIWGLVESLLEMQGGLTIL